MKTHLLPLASLLAAALLTGCAAGGHRNVIDPVSNVDKLDYTDVDALRPDFDEPFLRDGVVSRPANFRRIVTGLTPGQVRQQLGEPLQEREGSRGKEWDYNAKFLMPASTNYLVCQYKVVFEGEAVRETVWRRRQCLDLVESASPVS